MQELNICPQTPCTVCFDQAGQYMLLKGIKGHVERQADNAAWISTQDSVGWSYSESEAK